MAVVALLYFSLPSTANSSIYYSLYLVVSMDSVNRTNVSTVKSYET